LDVFDIAAFEADPTAFYLVSTNIQTGQPVYRQIDHVKDSTLEWFRATSSMPIVSVPVEIEGVKYLDGGLVDCIPIQYFQSIGYERNIVILTQPKGYQKNPNKMIPLFRLFHHKYPKIAECMRRRHEMYNAQLRYIEEQAQKGNILVIYPDHPLDIGRIELDEPKLCAIYQHGREKGITLLDDIHAFLAN
jgi:predicted patatin/cPLA2 family phospholipase